MILVPVQYFDRGRKQWNPGCGLRFLSVGKYLFFTVDAGGYERVPVQPSILETDVNDLLKVREVFDRAIVIAFVNSLKPEFVVGDS
jgi:hypothetical protein